MDKNVRPYASIQDVDNLILLQRKKANLVFPQVILYRCYKCVFITNSLDLPNTHKEKHEDDVYKYEICDVVLNLEVIIKQHMLNEHKQRIDQLNCNMCSFQ